MENNSRNLRPELLQNIFIYLDLKSIFHLFMVCKKWYSLLGSSYFTSFWEEAYKNEFPHLYKRLTTTTQEELLLSELEEKIIKEKNIEKKEESNEKNLEEEKNKNENYWLEISLETLKYRFSDYAKKLRENESKIPTMSQIEIFVCRLNMMHSWYKHLPQYPGTKFLIYQRIEKVDDYSHYNNSSYYPTLTVENSQNDKIVNVWKYYDCRYIIQNTKKIDKLFTCYANCFLCYLRKSSLILNRNPKKSIDLEIKYGEKVDDVNYVQFMENIRMTQEFMDACINYVEVIYGVRLEKPKEILEFNWENKKNFRNYVRDKSWVICKPFKNFM